MFLSLGSRQRTERAHDQEPRVGRGEGTGQLPVSGDPLAVRMADRKVRSLPTTGP